VQQDVVDVAVGAHEGLCAWLAELNARSRQRVVFAAAKHIAFVALCLEAEAGLPREAALDLATALVGARIGFSAGSLKKNRSEALAILQFGPAPEGATRRPLFEAVLAANVSEVRRARADALRGARGGRPARGRPQVLAMVRELVRKAVRDPHAANELQLIRSELSG
jgi:hypothetical protein